MGDAREDGWRGRIVGGANSMLEAVTSVFDGDGEVFGYSGQERRRSLEFGETLVLLLFGLGIRRLFVFTVGPGAARKGLERSQQGSLVGDTTSLLKAVTSVSGGKILRYSQREHRTKL